ncbi:MAG TPA: LacI family DNA-binding transcriptional regulator [Galbitalea sp.]|jgi:DNA-binding LacI/PurR family transcriptional regulator|nr:LacI family DNA-binding transcriptional regulator [Galbitalea sp.]
MTEVPERAPNIRDVAREAGVSYQTVSRVLNDSPAIRPATRERILKVIEDLGYRPNPAARALVTARSRIIGVLSSQSALYGPTTSVQAIEGAARAAGYRITVTNIDPSLPESIRTGLDFLLNQSIEALVILAPQVGVVEAIRKVPIGVPFVMLEASGIDDGHSLSVDQTRGARLAVGHLIKLGHTEIVHIAGPSDWLEAQARLEGYRTELRGAGLIPRNPIIGDWTAESGYRAGRELLGSRDFTAVFCGNDQMALGFLHACRESGIGVPEDVSVVGFDDTPESAHFAPPLSTIRQNFVEIGTRAIALLLTELDGSTDLDHRSIAPALVIRDSTGPRSN